MSDITMEKKLELVQQIRSQYHKNQYDMSNREQILYGRSATREEYLPENAASAFQESEASSGISFKLRLLLALILLAGVIVLDKNGMKIAGIAMEEVFQAISADYMQAVPSMEELEAAVNDLQAQW